MSRRPPSALKESVLLRRDVSPSVLGTALGLPSSSLDAFLSGQVVTHELDASNDKDLSLLVATIVNAPVEKIYEFAEADRVSEIQAATLSAGRLDPADPLSGLMEDMDLTEDVAAALAKNPFLSKEEAKELKEAIKKGMGADAYKKILANRAKSYWDEGLEGITPYTHQGKGRDPAADLKSANDAVLSMIKSDEVRTELLTVPANSESGEFHSLQWAMQKGNDQAAPVLNHIIRIKSEIDGSYVSITRRFYSGTDYDASQILTGVIPTGEDGRSAIFYLNRTFSSAVSGFGGSAKRSIGRKMMKGKLVETMTNAQKAAKEM